MDNCTKNYTFIIPHKNSPELLKRCIASIPIRDDIQIIVVDDNSDPSIIGDAFNENKNANVEVIRTYESGGAGYARNVGMKYARGEWILFIDCDDMYSTGYIGTLDEYANKDIDVLYFNFKALASNQIDIDIRRNKHSHSYDMFDDSTLSLNKIRYDIAMPWNKMVRRSFLERHHIKFEERPRGNDIMFSLLVGYFARHIAVEKRVLYLWIQQKNSITDKRLSATIAKCIIENICRINYFYEFVGYKNRLNLLKKMLSFAKFNGIQDGILFGISCMQHYNQARRERKYYVKTIEQEMMCNYRMK